MMKLDRIKTQEQRWYLAGLFLLTVLVFSKTLFFGFVWDDHAFLVGQDSYPTAGLMDILLKPINGVEYLPLRDITYIVDYFLWG